VRKELSKTAAVARDLKEELSTTKTAVRNFKEELASPFHSAKLGMTLPNNRNKTTST